MDSDDPFHAGERALQTRAGVREQSAGLGRLVRDAMPDQHRELFARLPFVVVGSVDGEGWPQASLLAGPAGFIQSPDPRRLAVAALPDPSDPLAGALREGAALGLLGIEPHTRRRNRLNGVVGELSATGFTLEARQSFGNCPKYIQARRARWSERAAIPAPPRRGQRLRDADVELIALADTFYIASAYSAGPRDGTPPHGVDVSHRGGKPGFVRVDRTPEADLLTVPDFSGNGLFNTLGNLAVNPRAGLLFIEYARGDLLQLTCDAAIVWDGPELAAFAGAQRLLQLRVRTLLRRDRALALEWSEAELSPFLRETGSWPAE
jgi:predicted pyridoxine 5'-phosphate oxidase superfamily flavin-nucleotide-binding protein